MVAIAGSVNAVFTGFDMAGDALLEAGIRVDFKSEVVPAIGFDEAPVQCEGLSGMKFTDGLVIGVDVGDRHLRGGGGFTG